MIHDPFGIRPAVFELAPGQSTTVEVSTNYYRKYLYFTKYISKQEYFRRSWLDLTNLGLCEEKCSHPFVQLCWKYCSCGSYWRVFHCNFQALLTHSDFPHAYNPVKENRNLRTQESLFHSSWGVKSKKLFLSELSGKKKEHFGKKKILSL